MGKKVLLFILGLLVMFGGVFCVARPLAVDMAMIWIMGFVMFFYAIENIVTYKERKRMGIADGWNLAGAILGLICGLVIIISGTAKLIVGEMLIYILFIWMIISGIITLIGAFNLRKFKNTGEPAIDSFTGNWGWYAVLGVLMIIAGIFGCAYPLITALAIGIFVGVDIIVAGIQMMALSFTIASE